MESLSTPPGTQGSPAPAASVLPPFSFSEGGDVSVSTGLQAPPIMMKTDIPGARGTNELRAFGDTSVSLHVNPSTSIYRVSIQTVRASGDTEVADFCPR